MSIEDLTTTQIRKVCVACSREFGPGEKVCPHDGQDLRLLPQTDPMKGRRLGNYIIEGRIGTGGMGEVYVARHELMGRRAAIKLLRAQYASDQLSVKRFQQEARAVAILKHANIIETYDHGFTPDGRPYIAMEFVTGKSLADVLKEHKHLPVDRVIHIFDQACAALDHAHKKGVLHRDLKPQNIMLVTENDDPDFVKVVDFGVAKILTQNTQDQQSLTQQGEVCGSPVYMSPEQCLGKDLDRRADVYSMGVVLYEVLTGKVPLLGKNMMETMSKHINEQPAPFNKVNPDIYIPERMEKVVMRALAKDPESRQSSMEHLRQDLLFALPRPGTGQHLRTLVPEAPTSSQAQDRRWLMPAFISAVLALIGGAGLTWILLQQQPHQSQLQQEVRSARPSRPTSAPLPSDSSSSGQSPGLDNTIAPSPSPSPSAVNQGTAARTAPITPALAPHREPVRDLVPEKKVGSPASARSAGGAGRPARTTSTARARPAKTSAKAATATPKAVKPASSAPAARTEDRWADLARKRSYRQDR